MMEDTIIRTLEIENLDVGVLRELFGVNGENVTFLSNRYNVAISNMDGNLRVRSEDDNACARAGHAIEVIAKKIQSGENMKLKDMRFICDIIDGGDEQSLESLNYIVTVNSRGKAIKPKTLGQAKYLKSIEKNSVVFGVGPAGTGKTYLAVAEAVKAFKNKEVERIILTRPAVEAGEKLGFLPGDLGAKVDPYLRPLYDALEEMFGLDTYARLIERGAIEIAPLAYMRGRTLTNAWIILDEAQNTTREQMKMFLTRMGEGSRIVVTGDLTQIDLPRPSMSGLLEAVRVLEGVEGLDIIRLTGQDVVRHEMVMRIVDAYERSENNGAIDEQTTKN